jgi:hypothetical protein
MPHRFGENDIFNSTIKAYPKYVVNMYHNLTYINGEVHGANVNSGKVSLYEINIDRPADGLVKAIIIKGENSNDVSFVNVTEKSQFEAAANFTSSYPLTSSVVRELVVSNTNSAGLPIGIITSPDAAGPYGGAQSTIFKLVALKNSYDYYQTQSKYFEFNKYILASGGMPPRYAENPKNTNEKVSTGTDWTDAHIAALGLTTATATESIPKNLYTNVIIIPSIFYGSSVKRGTVNLKYYYTGSLLAQASDERQNGELIESTGPRSGSIIGTVLYNEGVILITASYNLDDTKSDGYLGPAYGDVVEGTPTSGSWYTPASWAHFGAYSSYITSSTDASSSIFAPISSSYILEFKGTTYTPVLTMLAHAKKNELNWSNNPTFIDHANLTGSYVENYVEATGSSFYMESKDVPIKNIISSSFSNHSASYQQKTFISKIGIYDEDKNLIAIAKLATPIAKTAEQDYTFKLKLDI